MIIELEAQSIVPELEAQLIVSELKTQLLSDHLILADFLGRRPSWEAV